jgi:hypothetical protein
VAYRPETPYFVRLDEPQPASRHIPLGRERHYEPAPSASPGPQSRRRKRRFHVHPVVVLLLLVAGWVGWAFTTPGGPSARIDDWVNQVRGQVNNVSMGPGLGQTVGYFNQLYANQGSYPDMSQTEIQEDPNAGMGLSTNFFYCTPQAVVLQDASAAGTVSRLLLLGVDQGQVSGAVGCPTNLAHPSPWKIKKKSS